ncbi:non-ribosomal peptide synthetase [Streptomyces sp. A1136]|uniref:non-ribosomal peptide synthetase n=1 Tax=Streptomyces sp. A1136 TaxID=2563102 RepID=UPI00109E89FA|nr:non-ribosomal peptide synthetase [Streptomyces sp. A1136]THA54597.1 amino acid adenylation domain-containing protein [Streptomyces sp. A1136]
MTTHPAAPLTGPAAASATVAAASATVAAASAASAAPAATADERRALLRAELLRRAAAAGRPAAAVHPVSEGQRALWLFEQMHPDSPAYRLCFAATVTGPLDAGALRTALQGLLDHHPVLRTAVLQEDGELVQRIRPEAAVEFDELDLTGRPDRDAAAQAAATAFAERPYDLAAGAFLRARVLRLAADRAVLLLGTHHIAADLWAFSLMLRDLQAAYPAARAGRPVVLAAPAADYPAYVRWQRELVAGDRGRASADFWREQLSGEVPRLELPADRRRPPRPTHRTAVHTFSLGAEVTDGLRRVARETGGTLYTATLTVFNLLMHRYTGQDDIWLGSVSTGRGKAAFEDVVGYFANLMVLRTRITPHHTFRTLLEQVRETALDAMEHQDYPYPLVAGQAAQGGADGAGATAGALFDVAFFYESASYSSEQGLSLFATGAAGARLDIGDLRLEPYPLSVQGSEQDLTVFAEEVDGRVSCSLRYATDLFDRETAEALGRHFRALAAACAARPDTPHGRLPMLSDADRRQVLSEWSRPGDPAALAGRGVHELVLEQAARTPDATAVSAGEERLSYAELAEQARALALVLRSYGVGPEVKVGLSGDGTPRLFVGLLAILMAGGAYIPLDPTYPVKRLEYMIEDSSVALLLAQRSVAGRLPVPDGVPVLYLDDSHEPPSPAPELPAPDGGRLAYVIYTSGSTGRPKGVMVEHAGLVDFDHAHREALPAGPGRRVLQNASISFDVSTWEWMMALTTGATLVVAPREELRPGPPLIDTIRRERITSLSATPSVLATMDPADLPTVTELTSVGEAVSADLVRAWSPGRRIVNAYGPTEITVFCTTEVCVPDGSVPPIGRALPGTELYVLDAGLRPVPAGVVGELFLGGTGVTRGYQNRPDLTADRYVPHPFTDEPGARLYRTGDRVRFDRQGTLHYLGRADHQVKIRGVRIEPGEVQDALDSHPGVREAVVMARPGRDGRLVLAGYVLREPDAEAPTVAALRAHLAERLTSAMIPSHLFVLDAFPLNPNGKVDRALLPAPEELPEDGAAATPPSTPTERAVAEVWSELLGIARIGADAHFFELGGHSLLAVRAAARLREHTGVELPLRDLFDAPVLRAVAARIDGLRAAGTGAVRAAEPAPLPRLPRGPEGLPLSSAQQRLWFVEQLRPGGLAYRIAGELHLDGPLDPAALRAAMAEVVRRHEALRTVFTSFAGEPRQLVTEVAADAILPVVDLSGLGAEEREEARAERSRAFFEQPFDLTRSPLHTQLIRLAEDRHTVQLSVHHIAADGWSVRLVVRELTALYAAYATGASPELPEPPVQYPDFAHWQRERQSGEAGEAELAHWASTLAGAPAHLELPTDRPRRDVGDRPAARERRTLGADLAGRLRTLAGQHNASLSMALLTGYAALLSRWSGQEDVVVGMPVAGRTRPDLEQSVGLYVNTVAVRTDTSGAPGFRDLLGRVRTAALDADAHQDVPFERVVDRLAPDRDLTRTPVFQVLFNMLNLDDTHPTVPGVRTRLAGTEDLSARYDLTLYVTPDADGSLGLDLVYDASLFDAGTVAAFLDQFEALLASAAADPAAPVAELALPRPSALPDPARPLPAGPWTAAVHERFARAAAARPDAVALRHGGRDLTYGELDRASAALAAELASAGIGPGRVAAVHAERSPALVVAVLAALRAGAAFSLLDRAHPVGRRERTARALGAAAWLETGAELPEVLGPGVVFARSVTADAPAGAEPAAAAVPAARPAAPGDTAYVAFTSGTTGAPKGVVGSHAPLAHFTDWYTRTFGIGAEDRFALTSGLSHDPLLRDLFVPLSVGARLHIPEPGLLAAPEAYARWLAAEGITVLHLTPPTARFLSGLPDGCLPSLRLAVFGGDTLTGREAAVLRRLAPGVRLVNFYGATETPQAPAWYPVGEPAADEQVPLGTGIDGAQLLVLRGERPATVGELGEITVRTPHLAEGYLGPDEAGRFRPDPAGGAHGERLYRTGDLGRHRPDGTVVFAGRADRQVKVRGHRVDLSGVEHALRGHPAVTAAVVATVADATGELGLAAWATTDGGADAAALRAHLLGRLPAAMVPATVDVVEAFPLTTNGKVDTARLRAWRRSAATAGGAARTPATRTEETVRSLWQELLGVEDIGRDDTFFGRGGHSLQLVPLQLRLREELGVDVPVLDLLRHPTVAALGRHVDGLLGGTAAGPGGEPDRSAAAREQAAERARRAADRRRRMRRGQGDV